MQLPSITCPFHLQADGWSSCTGQVRAWVSICFRNTDIALKTTAAYTVKGHMLVQLQTFSFDQMFRTLSPEKALVPA